MFTPFQVLAFAWVLWGISWFAASGWRDRAVGGPGALAQVPYLVLVMAGFVLLFRNGVDQSLGLPPVWQFAPWQAWTLCGVGVIGLLFTWWARLHLGRLWSSTVTRKAGHHIVDTGPYGLVRHPIYTGVTLSGIAMGMIRGTIPALAGAATLTLGWYVKARLEERFLREQLGAEQYEAYSRRVPMMVPFWRW